MCCRQCLCVMVFTRFQMDCWERWNIISCIISVLKKIDNESVPLLACILLTFVEINLKNRYPCRVETFCYSGVLLNVFFESLEQWGWVDQVRFFFFFFPFLNHSENNMAYSEASWREKKCSVNCIKLNFFLNFFLSFSLPSFLFFTEPAESSCGIQSQGIVWFL